MALKDQRLVGTLGEDALEQTRLEPYPSRTVMRANQEQYDYEVHQKSRRRLVFSALLLDVSRNGFRKGMPASPALACSNLYR